MFLKGRPVEALHDRKPRSGLDNPPFGELSRTRQDEENEATRIRIVLAAEPSLVLMDRIDFRDAEVPYPPRNWWRKTATLVTSPGIR